MAAVFTTHTYQGNSEINFFQDDQGGLFVTIDTERLHMRSVEPTEIDYDNYAALFGDQNVMEKFFTGQIKTREEIETLINNIWGKRWKESDPYSALAIFRKDTGDFLGHIVLGHSNQAGHSEIAYLFHQPYWRQGYGSEAVTAIVTEYAPATILEGYTLEGVPLQKITATVRPDNPASWRILEKVGMHFLFEEEKYGSLRCRYSIGLQH